MVRVHVYPNNGKLDIKEARAFDLSLSADFTHQGTSLHFFLYQPTSRIKVLLYISI
jgi:hypothetical protein